MRILLVDNNDSFTYNLADQLARLGAEVEVQNIDTLTDPKDLLPHEALVISPGPKAPKDYPFYQRLLTEMLHGNPVKPLLGVCLGHQILGEFFGAHVGQAPQLMHGKTSLIQHNQTALFEGILSPMKVARYHSLIVDQVPGEFERLAETEAHELMAMKHKNLPWYGIQFHPESFLTEQGDRLIQNFFKHDS